MSTSPEAGTAAPPVVFVTGGSRGIGAACARAFARAGWDVAVGYRDDEAAAGGTLEAVHAAGRRGLAVRADVAAEGDVEAAFARIDAELGRPGALVCCAGVAPPVARVAELAADRVRSVLDVNVVGTLLCCREAVRRMSHRHGGAGGSIVTVSSGAALLGSPGEFVDYAASKAAVEALTRGLAKEVGGEGVRVNAVRPGIIDTEIHGRGGQPDKAGRLAPSVPLGRVGSAAEVAAGVLWLCSAEASYVNGAVLDVTGGR